MRNKILIGVGIALALFVVLLLILCGGAGSGGTVTQEQYESMVSGITAEISESESKIYSLEKLTDDIQFNSEIENKAYTKLTINKTKSFKTLGVVFLTKADNNCSIKFTLMKNDEVLKSTTLSLEADTESDINLLLATSVDISLEDNFYIKVEETGLSEGEEKTNFVFDSLLSFFDEE